MKTYNIITIFPDMFNAPFNQGVVSKAVEKNILKINPINLRDYAEGKHRITDDYQYGGGVGLVMKPEPICQAVRSIQKNNKTHVILLDPKGKKFCQQEAERLSTYDNITFICGRYEGVDERVKELVVDEEFSIGDFILTGGELGAMVMIDSIARLIDGVLGDETSKDDESFTTKMLEYPHYTRPYEYEGLKVPDVLINGNHASIDKWRKEKSLELTKTRRPDLLDISLYDNEMLKDLCSQKKKGKGKELKLCVALMHYPMKDKQSDIVATAITNLDLHDISRSCRTYGVDTYFVITPIEAQREVAGRVISHWINGYGAGYNPNRKEAFSRTVIKESLLQAIYDIEKRFKKKPIIVATTARPDRATITSASLGLIAEKDPVLLLFGTGWGFADEVFNIADYVLEPIEGASEFNHLSVRSAVAILLDRITEKLGG